jgi:hypothetical protein
MPGDDLLLDAEFVHQRAEPHAQRLDAHQVDFLAEQPARVVFAKAGGQAEKTSSFTKCVTLWQRSQR